MRVEGIQGTTVVAEERGIPWDKTQLYRWLIQQAFCDLLTAIRNPEHKVSSDLYSAREALSVALKAQEMQRKAIKTSFHRERVPASIAN